MDTISSPISFKYAVSRAFLTPPLAFYSCCPPINKTDLFEMKLHDIYFIMFLKIHIGHLINYVRSYSWITLQSFNMYRPRQGRREAHCVSPIQVIRSIKKYKLTIKWNSCISTFKVNRVLTNGYLQVLPWYKNSIELQSYQWWAVKTESDLHKCKAAKFATTLASWTSTYAKSSSTTL